MAKKDAARGNASATKPKQLRKRLRKAEAKLAEAAVEREGAQARVEALAIIADEIRAQLAESEGPATEAETTQAKDAGAGQATEGILKRASRKHAARPKAASATVART